MTIFVRGENPIWFFNNLIGQPLDDTYWAFFLTNDLPYIPQAVYQDPNGISPWANPLEFQPSGGLPNNLYFDPNLVYRIEIRQGPNQTDPLIWLIENYVPSSGSGGGSVVSDQLTVAANLITNPNFSDVDFVGSYTYTQASPGTYTVDIAPGWQLVLTGSGTTILTQGQFTGDSNTFGNPPYYLGINNSGWTTATLKQTLSNNGAIFANGAIAVAFTAQAITTNETITVNYVPNGTANSQTIFSGSVTTAGFVEYYGAIDVNPSVNNNTDGDANVSIQFVLPGIGNVQLTNIQVVGQSVPLSDDFVLPGDASDGRGSVPVYQELTYEQIVNGEFNVFQNAMLHQPKDTFLVGWDFALNPWQFTTKTVTNVAANQYTADQTIVIQQNYVASATGNNIAVGQAPETNNLGFEAKAVTAHNQFGILQYIPAEVNTPYFGSIVSSMVKAQLVSSHSSTVKIKMRLFYLNNSPSSLSQSYPVASWTELGDPVFAAGITAVIPNNDPVYTLTSDQDSFAFNDIALPDLVNTPQTLGIFVYTVSNMNQAATADEVIFNDISLVHNDYALASNPKTADEVLRECEYYFEKSYIPSDLPGANTDVNMITAPQNMYGTDSLYVTSIPLQYKQTKFKIPTPVIYAQDGTINTVKLIIFKNGVAAVAAGGSPNTNPFNANVADWAFQPYIDRALMVSQGTTTPQIIATTSLNEGFAQFHYTLDSRIGT